MAKSKEYSEIDDIKQDIDSLRNNVVELTKHLRSNGNAQIADFSSATKAQMRRLQKSGQAQVKNLEKNVRTSPMQSLAIAFTTGVVASILLRGRR